jgi:hypothetical protein
VRSDSYYEDIPPRARISRAAREPRLAPHTIEVTTEIEIAASAETVWRVLTELERYPEWNPFIRSARGSLDIGGTVRLSPRTSIGVPLRFHATIVTHDEPRELRWRGQFIGSWLATGDHSFVIEPIGDRRVRFVHSEKFTGLLPRLGARLLEGETRHGFSEMNRALAARAERAEVPS